MVAWQCTEVPITSFLCGWFITAIVVNPLERKLAKRTSVQSPNAIVTKLYFAKSR
jgi:RNA polymerase subunit RPABC4/transcription elongation factor Spt4